MSDISLKQLILTYVEGWKSGDREQILRTLDPACVVIESYGPTYRGKEMVVRWIDSWFAPGNVVNRWDVTSLYVTDEACFFEWIIEGIRFTHAHKQDETAEDQLQEAVIKQKYDPNCRVLPQPALRCP
jgi:hypothetical protein